jgi:multicomponent Na+:H+ antiporter subunit G
MNVLVAYCLFALGLFFGVLGNIGILRFPDVYTRLQASGKCSTTSLFSILIGCMFLTGFSAATVKIMVIAVFFLITGPITTHIIGRRAWKRGVVPFRRRRPHKGDQGQ